MEVGNTLFGDHLKSPMKPFIGQSGTHPRVVQCGEGECVCVSVCVCECVCVCVCE